MTAVSLREKKRRRTRDMIAACAFVLFQQKGYDATRVEDIAAAADCSPRTLYRYFSSKEAIVFEFEEQCAIRLKEICLQHLQDGFSFQRIRDATCEFASLSGQADAMALFRATLVNANPALRARGWRVREVFEQAVADAIRSAGAPLDAPEQVAIVSASAVSALLVAAQVWTDDGGVEPLADVACRTFDVLCAEVAREASSVQVPKLRQSAKVP